MRPRFIVSLIITSLIGISLWTQRLPLRQALFNLTGEEKFFAQVRALGQWTLDQLRPRLNLQPETPIQHNGVNPFGINTFLQQEVEPAKRERQVQLIAEAGFHWLRQEFPWYDLEISGKGNFEDCRFPPCHSAWDKYDQIVNLADEYNLEIIARLSSPPDWSRAAGSTLGAFAPPDNFTDFADFAVAVAERYQGRLRYFQIWNEPNGNDEWGYQPVDPEAYTRLLCETYQRLKAVNPSIVILAAALTPTNELGGANPNGYGGNNLSDLIYLQRMYNAGAKDCFDILSVQGYGLFSGPTDQRRRPVNINFGRNQFLRDVMVANSDAHKALWIAEMNWNAVPDGLGTPFGQVTEQQQAEYASLAYQRAQAEWPWVGAVNFWYFKDADEHERDQAKYYFRMANPDFTLLPVYESMKAYTHQPPVMYPGWYQEDHWAVSWSEGWRLSTDPNATFGVFQQADTPDQWLRFTFSGTDLFLITVRGPRGGALFVTVDGQVNSFELHAESPEFQVRLPIAQRLRDGAHTVEIRVASGDHFVDGFIVRRVPDRTPWLMLGMGALLALGWWKARPKQNTDFRDKRI